jgi:hypothetical protein
MNPSKIPDELAGLTPEQLNIVHLWLDEHPYRVLVPKLKAELGVEITRSKLSRYSCSRDLADNIEDATGLTVQVQDLVDMYNGQPTRFDQASLILIQKRVLELAADSKTKPGLLKDLFRIATYADRKSWVDHRKEINTARLALDNRKQELREKQFEHQKSIDKKKFPAPEPPPRKLTDEEKQERIWDIFHIPEEERVRRRALNKAARAEQNRPVQPELSTATVTQASCQSGSDSANSNTPVRPEPSSLGSQQIDHYPSSIAHSSTNSDQSYTSHLSHNSHHNLAPQVAQASLPAGSEASSLGPNSDFQSALRSCPLCSAPEPHLAPINLARRTNAYTVLRAEEYVAHRRSISAWMDTRRDPPEYISQLRECPCGSALPCPHHDPFPDYFWKLSPFSLIYQEHFQARNLPYREPREFNA